MLFGISGQWVKLKPNLTCLKLDYKWAEINLSRANTRFVTCLIDCSRVAIKSLWGAYLSCLQEMLCLGMVYLGYYRDTYRSLLLGYFSKISIDLIKLKLKLAFLSQNKVSPFNNSENKLLIYLFYFTLYLSYYLFIYLYFQLYLIVIYIYFYFKLYRLI